MSEAAKQAPDSFVMFREKTKSGWKFLTSGGGSTTKRVHAAQFTIENAEKMIAESGPDNPEFEFKIVPIDRKRKPAPIYAARSEDALRNGSYCRNDRNGTFAEYMNGDYMGTRSIADLLKMDMSDYRSFDKATAKRLLPKCCG